jgi:AcrR family transcriptional regulator
MARPIHPTKERLIETVSLMLDGEHPQDILVDDVLEKSGISRGSLYHHFTDFPGLLEATLIARFSAGVDETTSAMTDIATTSVSKDEFWQRMKELTVWSQSPSRAGRRAERARTIGMAASSDRFRATLAVEQERLTTSIADIVLQCQNKGWVSKTLSAHAIAVFIQAYSLGRAVDDIALTQVDPTDWIALIEAVTTPLVEP